VNLGDPYYLPLTAMDPMATNERNQNGNENRSAKPKKPETDTNFIDGPHGRHGGSEESEGRPQERSDPSHGDKRARNDDSADLP
jgi:hypothetical protein